jgi:hypothetical protein
LATTCARSAVVSGVGLLGGESLASLNEHRLLEADGLGRGREGGRGSATPDGGMVTALNARLRFAVSCRTRGRVRQEMLTALQRRACSQSRVWREVAC